LNDTLTRLDLAEKMNAALEDGPDGFDELRARNHTERGIARLSSTTKHFSMCPPAPAKSGQIAACYASSRNIGKMGQVTCKPFH
jgi:hypothetical protein